MVGLAGPTPGDVRLGEPGRDLGAHLALGQGLGDHVVHRLGGHPDRLDRVDAGLAQLLAVAGQARHRVGLVDRPQRGGERGLVAGSQHHRCAPGGPRRGEAPSVGEVGHVTDPPGQPRRQGLRRRRRRRLLHADVPDREVPVVAGGPVEPLPPQPVRQHLLPRHLHRGHAPVCRRNPAAAARAGAPAARDAPCVDVLCMSSAPKDLGTRRKAVTMSIRQFRRRSLRRRAATLGLLTASFGLVAYPAASQVLPAADAEASHPEPSVESPAGPAAEALVAIRAAAEVVGADEGIAPLVEVAGEISGGPADPTLAVSQTHVGSDRGGVGARGSSDPPRRVGPGGFGRRGDRGRRRGRGRRSHRRGRRRSSGWSTGSGSPGRSRRPTRTRRPRTGWSCRRAGRCAWRPPARSRCETPVPSWRP